MNKTIKKIVKKIIGKKKLERYRRTKIFRNVLSKEMNYGEISQIEKIWLRTIIMAHSIEKSMAINDIKSLFSMNRYINSIDDCRFLIENGVSPKEYVVVEICSVVKAALSYIRNKTNDKTGDIYNIQLALDSLIKKYNIVCHDDAGIKEVKKEDLMIGKNFDWRTFSKSRKSIRIYTSKIIEENIIKEIIEGADSYPSACNRQPCRVYYGKTKEEIEIIGSYVNDTQTVKNNIHNYFIVTCDRNKFSESEIYQNYINGGIYLSYLILSIHSLGFGSCIFQYVQHNVKDSEFHKKIGIPMNESIIAFVGFGEIDENNNILCAHRQGFSDSAKRVEICDI